MASEVPGINLFMLGVLTPVVLAGVIWGFFQLIRLFDRVSTLEYSKKYDKIDYSSLQARISSLEFDMAVRCPSMISSAETVETPPTTSCLCKTVTPKCAAKSVEDA